MHPNASLEPSYAVVKFISLFNEGVQFSNLIHIFENARTNNPSAWESSGEGLCDMLRDFSVGVFQAAKPWGIRDDFQGLGHPYSCARYQKIDRYRDQSRTGKRLRIDHGSGINLQQKLALGRPRPINNKLINLDKYK